MSQHDQTCSFFTSGRACDCGAAPGAPQQEASGDDALSTIRAILYQCDRDNVSLSWLIDALRGIVFRAAATAPAGGVTAELAKHLRDAHAFIENSDAFGHSASHGILDCGGCIWNVDESKAALARHEAGATAARAAEPAADVNVWLPGWSHVQSATAPAGGVTEDLREFLGKMVRLEWTRWAAEQPNPKPSWLKPWNELDEPNKEVDRRIGEAIWRFSYARDAALTPAARAAEPEVEKAWNRFEAALNKGRDEDAARYQFLRTHRSVLLLTGFFGNGCVNRTIEEVDEAIDAALAASPTPPTGTSKGEGTS